MQEESDETAFHKAVAKARTNELKHSLLKDYATLRDDYAGASQNVIDELNRDRSDELKKKLRAAWRELDREDKHGSWIDDESELQKMTNEDVIDELVKVVDGHAESKAYRDIMHIFPEQNVYFVRGLFNACLVWFVLLMIAFAIVTPYAGFRAATWTKDQMAVCEGETCAEHCQSLEVIDYMDDCRPPSRPYGDTPVWFMKSFRHEFGVYWIALITAHVSLAWLLFPSYLGQMFITNPGGRVHKLCGTVVLLITVLLWSFGGIAASILVGSRGLHPCAHVIKNYYNPNPHSGDMASSFTTFLYLQFMYDGPLLNECLMHGIAARLLIGIALDIKYDYIKRSKPFIEKYHVWMLKLLSYGSLFLYFCRTIIAIGIWIAYQVTLEPRSVQRVFMSQCTDFDEPECSDDGIMEAASTYHVSESMCIMDDVYLHNLANTMTINSAKLPYVSSTTLMASVLICIFEGVLIFISQRPNLKHADFVMKLMVGEESKWSRLKQLTKEETLTELHEQYKDDEEYKQLRMKDDKDLREMSHEALLVKLIKSYKRKVMVHHGANLVIAGWVVIWTFLGNLFMVFNMGGAIPYAGGMLALILWHFCKCTCKRDCVSPFSCRELFKKECCLKKRCAKQKSLADCCVAVRPPNWRRWSYRVAAGAQRQAHHGKEI